MPNITGIKSVERTLQRLEKARLGASSTKKAEVIVGYTASYAVFVHENKEAHHEVGQAKFLEQPARELGKEMSNIIATASKKGATLLKALLLAGRFLQRKSQLLVPVDTSNLKGSAFTREL